MQSVLIYSRMKGKTGWIPVGGHSVLRLRGMKDGDLIRFVCRPGPGEYYVGENGDYEIREGTRHIQVEHQKCSGSRVSADLVGNGSS